MKRYFQRAIATIITTCVATAVWATVPVGYYSSLSGKSGQALKNAIYEVIRPHTQLTYASLWNHFIETDAYPEEVNGKLLVWDMYSDNKTTQKYYYYGGTSGLNREHSLPKSWWGGDQVEAYTDINHLYPSDATANTAKNNYPLGVVLTATFNNGVCKVGTPQSGMGGGCPSVFEPADEYKGDFARTYFYMATCYQDYTWKYTYMLSNSNYLTLSKWAYDMLLEWSRNDPVSQKEIDRNEAVFKIQNNRNPFIDNPGLEEYIWGNKMGETYTGETQTSGDPELIYPVVGSTIDFGEIAVGKSVSIEMVVKAQNLTNNLKILIYGTNKDQFESLTVSSISPSMAAKGFNVKVTYSPTVIGEHTARLLFSDGGLPDTGVGVEIKGVSREVPTLSTVVACDATEITDDGFYANWQLCSEQVDFYNVNHCVYNGSTLVTDETVTVPIDDIDDNAIVGSTYFTNEQVGYTHTYRVQASRLGCYGDWSETITLIPTALGAIEASKPLQVMAYEGCIVVRCSQTHTNMRVHNMQGQLLYTIPTVNDGEQIALPMGVYLITTDQCVKPVKALVK
ncbi:MAG: endonuclease [Muribaculaceae bacterium]